MTNYGYVNGWKETPEQVKKCRELKHKIIEKNIGRCRNQYTCEICQYTYKVDSSDWKKNKNRDLFADIGLFSTRAELEYRKERRV